VPPLLLHAAPSILSRFCGIDPLHESFVHSSMSSGTSFGSAAATTLPAPSHSWWVQSVLLASANSVPASCGVVPQRMLPLHTGSRHGAPRQSLAMMQPTQTC
jgi:hypothetical protein